MKRFFLVLIGLTCVFSPVMSQVRLGDFTMRGAASQEMKADGFVAAHPSFPLNSKVKITNPKNGREIEATIIDRIDPSIKRIIDISPSALQALGMRAGDQVVLTVGAPPRPVTRLQGAFDAKNDEPTIELGESAEVSYLAIELPSSEEKYVENTGSPVKVAVKTVDTEKKDDKPYNVTVNAYLDEKNADNKNFTGNVGAPNNNTDFLAWLMTMSTLDAREAREAREIRESREIREAREAREAVKIAAPAPRQLPAPGVPPAPVAPQYMQPSAAPTPPATQLFFESAPVFQTAPVVPQPAAPPPVAPQPAAPETPQPAAHPPVQTPQASVPEPPPVPQYVPPVATQPPVPPTAPNYKHVPPPAPELVPPVSSSVFSTPVLVAPPSMPVPVAQPAAPVTHASPAAAYPLPVKADDVQIIGLPNRNSGKTYRLQVGAYSAQDTASKAAEFIKASGFEVGMESSGSMFRVLVIGIASADVHPASVRLGSLGFRQIWVRE